MVEIKSEQQLRDYQAILREKWLQFLGTGPQKKPPLNIKQIAEEKVDGCIRELITFETHDGVEVPTYIIKPENIKDPLPGIVSFHQTTDCTIDEAGGLAGKPELHIGLHLAQKGFVTVNPKNYLWDYKGLQRPESVSTLLQEFPHWKGMGKMLWDGMRAVDLLQSLPYVKSDRLGTIGHSLGGKEAFYLAAFDSRIKVAVSSEMGIGLEMSNWQADHYLSQKIGDSDFKLTHQDILNLIATKPFMLAAGDSADGLASETIIKKSESIYNALDAKDRIRYYNHHQKHTFPPEAQNEAYTWLGKWI